MHIAKLEQDITIHLAEGRAKFGCLRYAILNKARWIAERNESIELCSNIVGTVACRAQDQDRNPMIEGSWKSTNGKPISQKRERQHSCILNE